MKAKQLFGFNCLGSPALWNFEIYTQACAWRAIHWKNNHHLGIGSMQQIAASNTHPRHGTDMEFPAILGRELALTFPKANCGARQVSDWSLVAGRVWAVKSSFPCMNLPCSCKDIYENHKSQPAAHRKIRFIIMMIVRDIKMAQQPDGSSEKILLQFVVRVIRHPSFSSPRARLFLAYCDKSGKEKSFNCRYASKFFAWDTMRHPCWRNHPALFQKLAVENLDPMDHSCMQPWHFSTCEFLFRGTHPE